MGSSWNVEKVQTYTTDNALVSLQYFLLTINVRSRRGPHRLRPLNMKTKIRANLLNLQEVQGTEKSRYVIKLKKELAGDEETPTSL